MNKVDEFDKWFKSTYPEYCCGEAVIEPYYSIASYAWECAEQKQEKRITELEELLDAIDKAGEHVRQQINDAFRNKPSYAELEQLLDQYVEDNEKVSDYITKLEKDNAELKESYYVNRCLNSGCPYLHIDNRNCTKFGGYFTSVSNKDCPMMRNLNANIKLAQAMEIIEDLLRLPYANNWEVCGDVTSHLDKAEQFIKEN